ncbi:MAG TPA: class I SAM-dependent methyltransferase [Steroidobacteraceae bacterium]|nr:class I SAM-dependent methyltransferase [Steroidobacteraceae bacterium]
MYRNAVGAPPESKWKMLLPLLFEAGFAARIVRKRLKLHTPLNTTDRQVLEEVIFPHFCALATVRTVLFVGCGSYTAHYQRRYFPSADYWTLEPDPSLRRYGATQHVVAPFEELARHFTENSIDLIICNGVYGWGLDRAEQCEAAFSQAHVCLRPGGFLLLGWDDVPRRTPVPLESLPSLARFRRYELPALATWRYLTHTPYRHTYDFYQK